MDFCSIHFGKRLTALQYADIESFFSVDREESDQIEFKSYAGTVDRNLPGLIKSVCGFLNSKGGVIVWGAPVGVAASGKTEKTFKGALTPIAESLEKDRLISKVSDKIVPLPQGVRLQIIPGNPGEVVVVLEIDESEYSPHQTDGAYYMRMDGQTRPAPHHYVEALMKRIRYPNLEGYVKMLNVERERIGVNSVRFNIEFEVQLHNWSPLQNVEDLTYNVTINNGSFIQPLGGTGYVGTRFFKCTPYSVLHYGLPIRETHEFTVTSDAVSHCNFQLEIRMFLSGKNCPAKMCHYIIDLNKSTGGNGEIMVIERLENKLMKDIQDSLGATKSKILQDSLGRIP